MNKLNKISSLEYCIFVYFIVRSMSLGISVNSYLYYSGVDGYLCPIIGMIIGFIPLFIIIKIINYKPELNINEKIEYLFGNKIGKFINIIITLFFIFFVVIVMWNLINFIGSQYLYKTSGTYISIFFGICVLYICTKNINVIARVSNILFYISVIIFITCFLGLMHQIKIDNLLPFLEFGIKGPIIGGILHVIYSILPIFLILSVPKNKIYDNNKIEKKIILFYMIANIGKFVVIFFLISIFGIDLATLYEYPDYVLLRRISTTGFFQRFESILAIQWIFDIFVLITLSFYYIKNSCKRIFNLKNENIILFLLIPLIAYINTKIFKNNTIGSLFIIKQYPIIIGVFLSLILITIIIKIKLQKK